MLERKKASDFPPEVLKLFDQYVHGWMSRRDFLEQTAKYAVGGFTAAAMLESLLRPNYAWALQVPKDDARVKAEYINYPSPQGAGTVKAHLARPADAGRKLPGVIVSTRTAASIPTSRMSRGASRWRISWRSRPTR